MGGQGLLVELLLGGIVQSRLHQVRELVGQHVQLAAVIVYADDFHRIAFAQSGGQGGVHFELAGAVLDHNALFEIVGAGGFDLGLRQDFTCPGVEQAR
jgi:hypothetical protein